MAQAPAEAVLYNVGFIEHGARPFSCPRFLARFWAASLLLLLPAAAGAFTLSDNHWKVEDGPVEFTVGAQGTPDITDGSHENV